MDRADTVIVGGGAMGLSAAWQLARRGRQVLLLERESVGHLGGASHGSTRNFNQAYSDPHQVALLVESRRLWGELEHESGMTLLETVGIVNHGSNPAFDDVHAALSAVGIPVEFLPPAEARRRWPGIRFDSRVLYNSQSGRLRADAALAALRHGAISRGAEIREHTRVCKVAVLGDSRVRITTGDGQLDARRVIIAAGAWTEKLIGGIVPLPTLVVTQEQPAHFAARDASAQWPGFNHYPTPHDRTYDSWPSQIYGMRTPGEGIKVGWHGVGPVIDPDMRTFAMAPALLSALRRYVREWLPGADPNTAVEISCTYTTTPDTNFVLKRLGPITVGAGFSGHGFKFTPAVGRILADLACQTPVTSGAPEGPSE